MKKVLLVNGSPRRNGNTASALSIAERVLNEKEVKTERIEIGNKPVRGCIGCERCKDTYRCIFDDVTDSGCLRRLLAGDVR